MAADPEARTVYRTYSLSEDERAAFRARRQALGMTTRELAAYAVRTELPTLVRSLLEANLSAQGSGGRRPARFPLSRSLLADLADASTQTGVPACRLLLACFRRAASRKRRRKGAKG